MKRATFSQEQEQPMAAQWFSLEQQQQQAAPVLRGSATGIAVNTKTAPTSTIFLIDAETFRFKPTADHETVKDESAEDVLEVISNPGHTVSFTGTIKSGQTQVIVGALVSLTYPASHSPTGAVEYVVIDAGEVEGYGKVLRQNVTMKKNDAVSDYGTP